MICFSILIRYSIGFCLLNQPSIGINSRNKSQTGAINIVIKLLPHTDRPTPRIWNGNIAWSDIRRPRLPFVYAETSEGSSHSTNWPFSGQSVKDGREGASGNNYNPDSFCICCKSSCGRPALTRWARPQSSPSSSVTDLIDRRFPWG